MDDQDIGFIYNEAQYYILKQKFDDAIDILEKIKVRQDLILLIDLILIWESSKMVNYYWMKLKRY